MANKHPFIQSLQVENLGLFDNLMVNFTEGVNIIIGPNSSGKTSILRAITFCFNAQGLSKMKFSKNAAFGIVINQGNENTIMAGYESLDNDNETYQGYKIINGHKFPEPSFPPISGHVPYNLLAIGAHRFFGYQEVAFLKKEEEKEEAKKNYDKNNTDYIDKPNLPSIKQWMVNRYFQIDKDWATIEKANWERIINDLSRLAPDDNKFILKEIGRDLEPKFELNGTVCYLEELSSGFKSVLSVVFSIVQWIELVNEGEKRLIEKAEGTVLIDEIDSHLHPSWQAKIMSVLQDFFPSLQFIVTTHSPLVMSTIRNDDENSIQEIVYKKEKGYRCEKIETYGNDASSIIEGTLNTIPRDKKSNDELAHLYNLIDEEQYTDAEKKLNQLKEIYGDLPELIKAESMLTFLTSSEE